MTDDDNNNKLQNVRQKEKYAETSMYKDEKKSVLRALQIQMNY